MRLAGLMLAAVCGAAPAFMQGAFAQSAPSANMIAAAEVAMHCSALMQRADDLATFGLYAPDEPRIPDTTLDLIDQNYVAKLPEILKQAQYGAEGVEARTTVYRHRANALKTPELSSAVDACAFGAKFADKDTSTPPQKASLGLAMAGKGANDVLYVDMASLQRVGGAVRGWQLYVFRAEQQIGGKPAKAQWTSFVADCLQPTIATYGSLGIADPRTDAPFTVDTRGSPSAKPVQANTFGAATWMLACGVTKPTTTYASLAAAADHTKAQFGQ